MLNMLMELEPVMRAMMHQSPDMSVTQMPMCGGMCKCDAWGDAREHHARCGIRMRGIPSCVVGLCSENVITASVDEQQQQVLNVYN